MTSITQRSVNGDLTVLRAFRECQPEGIGPATRVVALIASGTKGRAHRTTLGLSANPSTVTQLDRTEESLLPAIVENGLHWGRVIVLVTKILRHGRCIDHLAGIEEIVRIESMLDLAKCFVDNGAKHFPIPFAAHQSIAMFSAQRSAIGQNQIGDVLHDRPHPDDIAPIFQIQDRTDVQAADAGMAVKRPVRSMTLQKLPESAGKFG